MALFTMTYSIIVVFGLGVYAAYAERKEDNTSQTSSNFATEANIMASSLKNLSTNATNLCVDTLNVSMDTFNSCNNSTARVPPISLENLDELKIYRFLLAYYYYFTNIPGFVTNPLTIMLIFHIKPFNTTSLYILVLSVNDFIIVILRFIYQCLDSISFYWTTELCCFFNYVLSSTSVFSTYILVFWTFERFCAVWFPLKLSSWFVLTRVKAIVLLLIICSFSITSPYTFGFYADTSPVKPIQICYKTEFLSSVWFFVDVFYNVLIPIGVVVSSNIAIIIRLNNTHKTRRMMTNDSQLSEKKKEEQRILTLTLISVSVVFVFLHVPYVLALLWMTIYPDSSVILMNNPTDFVRFHLYTSIGLIIPEFQNWINFFTYILSGKRFRIGLVQMFSEIRRPFSTHSRERESESRTQRRNTGTTGV